MTPFNTDTTYILCVPSTSGCPAINNHYFLLSQAQWRPRQHRVSRLSAVRTRWNKTGCCKEKSWVTGTALNINIHLANLIITLIVKKIILSKILSGIRKIFIFLSSILRADRIESMRMHLHAEGDDGGLKMNKIVNCFC